MKKIIKTNCELPLRLLKDEVFLNDFDFILFHLLEENETYRKHYTNPRVGGAFRKVILDCSAYEFFVRNTKLDVDKYIKAINEVKPDFYILPDVLMSLPKTIVGVELFPFDKVDKSFKAMGVIQGNSESDFLKMLEYYEDLNIKNIAIPFHNSFLKDIMFEESPKWLNIDFISSLENYLNRTINITNDIKYAIGRCWFIVKNIETLKKFDYIHLLGSHCVWEKHFLNNLEDNVVNSIDTGYPVKCAVTNQVLFEEKEKPNIIIDDFLERTDLNVDLIKDNIIKFRDL